MNERQRDNQPQQAGISLGDIYFVLFRRKWLIAAISGAGILAAVVLYLATPTTYVSEAKLVVRYVLENKSPPTAGGGSENIKSPDSGADSIMNSELEILTSRDLALLVATNVGPERILAKAGGGTNYYEAAVVVARGLEVGVPRRGNVILVRFRHPDPDLVRPVLLALMRSYLEKHIEIHRGTGVFDDFLMRKRDELSSSLRETEEKLRSFRTNAGIISLEDSRKGLSDQTLKIQEELRSAEAELAFGQALQGMGKSVPAQSEEVGVPADKVREYKSLYGRLDSFRRREAELLTRYTDDSPVLSGIRNEIANAEKHKEELETQYPKLMELSLPTSVAGGQPVDPALVMTARVKALAVKIEVLDAQLQKVRSNAVVVDDAGAEITRLQRERDALEANYRYYQTSVEQAKVDKSMGPGAVSNISTAQAPSPPAADISKKGKPALIALAAGILGSLALAFALELCLDRRIKRPGDVERKVHLPLFMVIPNLKGNGHGPLSKKRAERPAPSGEPGESVPDLPVVFEPISNSLKPYYEALRDRLLFHFHVRNMTHKPKLVGVTSCSRSSGATTTAAGLAAALSETGDGNVLLVDMNLPGGAAHPFHRGKSGCGLQEVLENEKRSEALVQNNLYLASAIRPSGSNGGLLPGRLSDLMPKLKTSDYDFIIFDLPAVSQTSATANLAGMLDMTLLVLESEKTNQDAAKRAASMFAESQANVAAVLNKSRTYLPSWLHQEI